MICLTFFSIILNNTNYLTNYHKTAKGKQKLLPGYHYFRKNERFIEHIEKGELYMEYLMGACRKDGLYGLCNF